MSKWEMVRLGDVCDLQNGYAFQSSDYVSVSNTINCRMSNIRPDGKFDIMYNIKYLPDNYADKFAPFILQDNDVIIAMTDMANEPKILGVPTVVDTKGYHCLLNQRVGKLIFNKKDIHFGFLKYVLSRKCVKQYYQRFSGGGLQINLGKKDLLSVEILLPSMVVQRKIADILDQAAVLIEKRKAQIAKLDLLVKAKFVDMFGDPVLNPKGWEISTIGESITFHGGSQPPKDTFVYKPQEGYVRMIQVRDYKSDRFLTYIPIDKARKFCVADDIMIGRYGPPLFQVLKGLEGAYNVALMKAVPNNADKEYARFYLGRKELLTYLEGFSQRTAGQDGVDMDMLKKYPFPMPPIEMQHQFADFVRQTEKSKTQMQQGLGKLELLYKSLMQKCFNGEVFK